MSLSSLKRFLPAAPARHVVVLPDALFFVRSVPVTEGATAADVASQAELAVESLAPFPVAQLYYGHHWRAGAAHMLVFAAYRKRFTSEEVETWADAEAVLPSFVGALDKGAAPAPATVIVIPGATSVTGLYFGDASGVPTQVRVLPLQDEATEEQRAAVREALLRGFPEKGQIVDLEAEPHFDPESPQGEFVFRAGGHDAHFEADEIAPLDVRDKGELDARRRAAARDVILWRTFVGAVAAIGLAVVLEVALLGLSIWQKQRLAKAERQAPVVAKIETAQALATRVEELSTKRLLPFEMLATINTARPRTIQFLRTQTSGLNTLEIEAQTSSFGDIDLFRAALNKLPAAESAEVSNQQSRDGQSTFRLTVKFKPDAFRATQETPMEPPAAPAENPENSEAQT